MTDFKVILMTLRWQDVIIRNTNFNKTKSLKKVYLCTVAHAPYSAGFPTVRGEACGVTFFIGHMEYVIDRLIHGQYKHVRTDMMEI